MQATRHRAAKPAHQGATAPAGQILVEAAKRNGVPLWVLVGVKLIETGTGSGVGEVSSAGAQGPFQFEPSTAKSMGVRDPNNFGEAANGAAALLAANRRQFGSWNAALEAYNGGPGAVGQGYAYTEADVKAKLRENGLSQLAGGAVPVTFLGNLQNHLSQLFGGQAAQALGETLGEGIGKGEGLTNPLEPGLKAVGTIGDLISLLTNGETWIRLGEILAGALLLYLGLKGLTGAEFPSVVPVPV